MEIRGAPPRISCNRRSSPVALTDPYVSSDAQNGSFGTADSRSAFRLEDLASRHLDHRGGLHWLRVALPSSERRWRGARQAAWRWAAGGCTARMNSGSTILPISKLTTYGDLTRNPPGRRGAHGVTAPPSITATMRARCIRGR